VNNDEVTTSMQSQDNCVTCNFAYTGVCLIEGVFYLISVC